MTDSGCHDLSTRGERYIDDTAAAPDFAMSYKQSADSVSRAVYSITLATRPAQVAGEGSREKSGKSNGAWWKMPPS